MLRVAGFPFSTEITQNIQIPNPNTEICECVEWRIVYYLNRYQTLTHPDEITKNAVIRSDQDITDIDTDRRHPSHKVVAQQQKGCDYRRHDVTGADGHP